MTDFGLVSIVRGMNSAAQNEEYMTSWAAPETLKGGGTITREADVFAFGMVVIEVGPHATLHPVLEVEVCLTSEWPLRLLREGIHSGNPQPRSSLQRLWMGNVQPVRRRRKG